MSTELTIALLNEVEKIAKNYSGHYTILKFTTNWKGFYGTPDQDIRAALDISEGFETKELLLLNMIAKHESFSYFRIVDLVEAQKQKGRVQESLRGNLKPLNELRQMYGKDSNNGYSPF